MHLKTLITLLLFAGGASPCFAFNGRDNLQDSVKQVSIKITATEKPRVLNFDSLLNVSQPAKAQENVKPKYSGKSRITYSIKRTLANKEKTSSQATKPVVAPGSGAARNTVTNNPQIADRKLAEHEQKIDEGQIISDSTVIDESSIKTARTYLWIGCMLIVVGIILGILFGKTALLISIAGAVFVTIGYLISH